MTKANQNISVINSLRGLAALSVCLYHFVCTTTGYIQNQTLLDVFHYGSKGVQVFFIISGIVIPLSMIKLNYKCFNIFKFMLKRFIRIEPPYLAAVILGILYLYVRNFIPSSAQIDLFPSLKDIFLHLGYLIPFFEDTKWINPVFWTLSVEFQYYLFLAITFPLVLSKQQIFRYLFYVILLVMPFTINYGQAFFTYWSAYFLMGILYILFKTKTIAFIEFVVTIILASIVVIFNQNWIDLLIALLTLCVIYFFRDFTNKLGEFLGKISYSLYLTHSIVGSAFVNFMSHRFTEPYQKFLVILTGVLITIVFSYVFWRLIEKPSHNYAKRIKI